MKGIKEDMITVNLMKEMFLKLNGRKEFI